MDENRSIKKFTDNREDPKDFLLLYKLAELGACRGTIKISTTILAKETGLSQQSASRRLINLERKGLIQRKTTKNGSFIRISRDGEEYLRRIYLGLRAIFGEKPFSIKVEGKVFSGLGEGAYYMSKEHYRKQFVEKLGFDPYPGTLNLKIISNEESVKLRAELDAHPGIKIEGFKNKDRTYGPVKCFHAMIDGREKGAVVLAFRSHYGKDVLEIIAPTCLRERLKLKDGDKVNVEIFLY